MSESPRCPECGAFLPSGSPSASCPACLMRLGLLPGLDTPGSTPVMSPQSDATYVPHLLMPPKLPSPQELAALFPELEILRLLGHGGMGAVYQARQTALDRLVALKIIMPEVADKPGFAERFVREARLLARLNHPHIVTIHDFGQRHGLHYLIMEFIDGVNLREVLQGGRLASREVLRIIPPLCEALQYAHEEGVVHRDIKPENILLDRKGRVKIADFGLARLAGQHADHLSLTGARQVVGTPRYMAPEQMQGSRVVDHRVDIYSLGVVFYEMLTGELPLGRFAPPSAYAGLDRRLDEIVLRALESDPDRRYQQATQIKTEVLSIAQSDHEHVTLDNPTLLLDSTRSKPPADAESHSKSRQLNTLAYCQMIVGALQILLFMAVMFLTLVRSETDEPIARESTRSHNPESLTFLAFSGIAALVPGCSTFLCSIRFLLGRNPNWLRAGAIIMLVPTGLMWGLSLPVGLWSLFVLMRTSLSGRTKEHRDTPPRVTTSAPVISIPDPLPRVDSAQVSAPWSGFGWVQKVVRRVPRQHRWNTGVILALMALAAAWGLRTYSRSGVLSQAARSGNTFAVRFYLLCGADMEERDANGVTPLMFASWDRQPQTVRQLLSAGADVNQKSQDGETALMKAAFRGQLNVVTQLLEAHATVNETDHDGETALILAANEGHVAIAQALLEHQADPRAATRAGWTPLMTACMRGHGPIVNLLLSSSQVDAIDQRGETALIKAAAGGHFSLVHTLLDAKANVNATNVDGATAIQFAIAGGHAAIVDALVANGVASHPLTDLYYGYRNARAGRFADALPRLQQAAEQSAKLSNGCVFTCDNWRYEIETPASYIWLLIGECEQRLGHSAEAKSVFQKALENIRPGTTNGLMFHRKFQQPQQTILEHFEIKTSEIALHVKDAARPWHMSRRFQQETRNGGHTMGSSGGNEDEIRDLFK